MKTLKILPCPVNSGKHPLHDNRYIVTSNAEVEFSYQMPSDWSLSKGSIICKMTDCPDQKDYATLFADALKTKKQLVGLKKLHSKALVQCEIYRGIPEIWKIYEILDADEPKPE